MHTQDIKSVIDDIFAEVSTDQHVIGDPEGELAYAYMRVSSSGQAEDGRTGLPRQLYHIHEKALKAKLKIPRSLVYSDEHSGFEFRNRPGLQSLLAETSKLERTANHVVIEYIDRLSRQAKWHQGFLLDLFAEHGVTVHFWKAFSSEIERAVMGAISEQGMRHEIERMVEGTRIKAQSGRITAKTPAYGYMFVDSQGRPATDPQSNYRKDTHYIPHPDEAPIIKEVYHRIVTGESLYAICNDLNQRGVPTAKGAQYWETGNLSKILRNRIYKGEYIANRYVFANEWSERAQKMVKRQRMKPESEWIIIPVPALVTPQVWQAAREALKQNMRLSMRNSKAMYLLQGFLVCAKCDTTFHIGTSPRKARPFKVHHYDCGSRHRAQIYREQFGCGTPAVRGGVIDAHVWNSICQIITDPDLIINYVEQQTEKVMQGGLGDQLAYVERQLQKCSREDEQWDRAFAAEIFSIEEYRNKKASVAQRRENLQEEQEKLQEELQSAHEFQRKKEMVRRQLAALRDAGIATDLPFADKRRIMRLLIDQIRIDTEQKVYVIEGAIKGTYSYEDNNGGGGGIIGKNDPRGPHGNFGYTSSL